MIRLSVFTFVFGMTLISQAGVEQKASAFVLCKNQKDVRTIRMMPDQENCKITYTKRGVDEVVGSNRSKSSCRSIVDQIKQTLESSKKWNCREVSAATLTTSAEVMRQ